MWVPATPFGRTSAPGGALLVRGLVERRATSNGFEYAALDTAGSLIASLATEYSQQLRERAAWVATNFASRDINNLNAFFKEHIGRWGEEFALTSPGWEDGN
jgi:hypothetical protein